MNNSLKEHFQTIINIILVILILVFGLWGFYILLVTNDENYKNAGILTVIYDTVRLLIMEWNLPPTAYIPWQLQVGRFSGFILVGFTIVQTIWHFFKEYFLLSFFYKGHVIICGLGKRGFEIGKEFLTKEYLNRKYKIVAIEKDCNSEYIQKIKELGGIVIIGDASDKGQLEKTKIYDAKFMIAVTDSDRSNIETVINTQILLESKKSKIKPTEPLKSYLHISEKEIAMLVVDNCIIKDSDLLENSTFSIYDNAARELFKEKPLYSTPTFNVKDKNNPKQFTILILGFGNLGEGVFRQAAKIAYFANLKRPKFIIVDNDIVKKEKYFNQRYPEIKNCCDVIFVKNIDDKTSTNGDYDIKSKDFYDQIVTRELDYIVVSVDNDDLSLNTSLNIINHYKFNLNVDEADMPIIAIKSIQERSLANALSVIKKDKKETKPILSIFASFESICNIDTIINERLDNMAKALNDYYAERYNGKKWREISIFHKESSRANAEHINTKLYFLDSYAVEVKKLTDQKKISDEQYKEYLAPKLELLSKIEHQRWNAFHYINGWRYNTKRDNSKKHHNCLTEWENLSEDDKQKDRDTIIKIPEILKEGGYQIVKIDG